MDLRQLEYFVAVADERSFTRGAGRVHVVQSAVSAAIGRLEREVRLPLFDRSGRQIELTDAGHAMLANARTLLAMARRTQEDMAALRRGSLSEVVTVGIVLATGSAPFSEALTAFHRDQPDVQIKVRLSAAPLDEQLRRVVDGTFDLAIVPIPDHVPAGVDMQPIGRVHLELACRPDDPLAVAREVEYSTLADRVFIDFPRQWGNRLIVDSRFEAAGCVRRIAVEVVDVSTAMALVAGGVGLAFVPAQHLRTRVDVVAVDLRDPPRGRRVGVAVPADRPMSAATSLFRVALLEQLETRPLDDEWRAADGYPPRQVSFSGSPSDAPHKPSSQCAARVNPHLGPGDVVGLVRAEEQLGVADVHRLDPRQGKGVMDTMPPAP